MLQEEEGIILDSKHPRLWNTKRRTRRVNTGHVVDRGSSMCRHKYLPRLLNRIPKYYYIRFVNYMTDRVRFTRKSLD